jgi:hypoxanthine phosphoribosyltransferase
MEKITIKGLTFEPYLRKEEIAKQVARVAKEIKRDCGDVAPLFLCVLNGAFVFAADLFRACDFHDSEITFIRYKSYEGMTSTGKIKTVMGLEEDLTDRTVIIVEDIVDTGVTATQLIATLREKHPRDIKLATLLFKPDSLTCDVKPDYVGFSIPSKFILGYGLDLDGIARNLSDIYVLSEPEK